MRYRWRRSWLIVLLGSVFVTGWGDTSSIVFGVETGKPFTLFAPSGSMQRLLVVRARPAAGDDKGGVALELARTVDLGFSGGAITAHPTQPVLYVSGGKGKDGCNAAVVPLDAVGLPQEPKPVTLDRGYAYLSTDRAGRFLLGCDYGSGAVDVFPLDAAGLPGKRVHGLDEGRKEAHCVLPAPDNRSVYIPYVKQNNALYQYSFDPATGSLAPLEPKDVGPPADSGPRHLVYHPRLPLVYFSEEQGLGVSAYRRAEDGRLALSQRSRAVPAERTPAGFSSSDIVITPDGHHLYTGIRGAENSIACYAVADDGSLAPRGLVSADQTPWGMAVSPDGRFLAVTGYRSATLTVYAIAADGSLTRAATLPWDERIADVIAR
jgi:6-phosphogluconolactonase (cycloisomerase 2 family)